jgi:ankyrin repeat protein
MKLRSLLILPAIALAGCAASEASGRPGAQGTTPATRPSPPTAQFDTFREAVSGGDLDAARAMLEKNPALAAAKDANGETALHSAIFGGSKEMAELLLTNKAEVNAANNRGHTPLHNAAMSPLTSKEMTELLIAHKADVNARDRNDETPLHAAANNGSVSVVEVLLGEKADANAKDKYGNTPLYWAAIAYRTKSRDGAGSEELEAAKEIIKLLLDYKADPNAENNNGITPLKVVEGHVDVAGLMRKYAAKE